MLSDAFLFFPHVFSDVHTIWVKWCAQYVWFWSYFTFWIKFNFLHSLGHTVHICTHMTHGEYHPMISRLSPESKLPTVRGCYYHTWDLNAGGKIGSDNGLLPYGTKPLTEAINGVENISILRKLYSPPTKIIISGSLVFVSKGTIKDAPSLWGRTRGLGLWTPAQVFPPYPCHPFFPIFFSPPHKIQISPPAPCPFSSKASPLPPPLLNLRSPVPPTPFPPHRWLLSWRYMK